MLIPGATEMLEVRQLSIRYPADKIEPGMVVVTPHVIGVHQIVTVVREGYFRTSNGYNLTYEQYDYSLVSLEDAIRLEDDPLKRLALQILAGDPMACDAARDVLRC